MYRNIPENEFKDIESHILYEDNHLLIFNKRSGEIVQADKTQDECLGEKLKAFIAQRDSKPGAVFLGVVHRLDRPVSGAVILAKTSKALERLNKAFREGDMDRHAFYFGNLDCYRTVANRQFQAEFDPPKMHWRADPYDNQLGEIEYEDRGLPFGDYRRNQTMVSFTLLD